MKYIIVVILIVCSIPVFAEIPGWLEIDANTGRYYDVSENETCGEANFNITYGGSFYMFKPFIYGGIKNQFELGSNFTTNYPFFEEYKTGIGVTIYDFFYVKLEHMCGHVVISDRQYYYGIYLTKRKELSRVYNKVLFGFKIHID